MHREGVCFAPTRFVDLLSPRCPVCVSHVPSKTDPLSPLETPGVVGVTVRHAGPTMPNHVERGLADAGGSRLAL